MKYQIIGTGSKGNCLFFHCGPFMIDLGLPYKGVREAMKKYRESAPIVFLTHKHGDHFNPATARALLLDHPATLFVVPDGMAQDVCKAIGGYYMQNCLIVSGAHSMVQHVYNGKYQISFRADNTWHDVPNVCWHISVLDRDSGKSETLFYATDTGHLEGIKARGYDYYFVEGNHKREELEARAREKLEQGQYAYEIRAARNHLSVEQAMDFLAENAGPNSRYILIHEHCERDGAKKFLSVPIDRDV